MTGGEVVNGTGGCDWWGGSQRHKGSVTGGEVVNGIGGV